MMESDGERINAHRLAAALLGVSFQEELISNPNF
jgi:hypothetical protein